MGRGRRVASGVGRGGLAAGRRVTGRRAQAARMLGGLITRRARRYFRTARGGDGDANGSKGGDGALELEVGLCFETLAFNGTEVPPPPP
jgi:hypothetical protein